MWVHNDDDTLERWNESAKVDAEEHRRLVIKVQLIDGIKPLPTRSALVSGCAISGKAHETH